MTSTFFFCSTHLFGSPLRQFLFLNFVPEPFSIIIGEKEMARVGKKMGAFEYSLNLKDFVFVKGAKQDSGGRGRVEMRSSYEEEKVETRH